MLVKNCRVISSLQIVKSALEDGTLEKWARAGATDKQLAHYLGIGKDSYIKAKKEIPDLAERIQRARRPLVPEAFNSLVRLANGYEYTETTEEIKDVLFNGNVIQLHTLTTYHRHQPPNLNALARVIVNYQRQEREMLEGVPEVYITAPSDSETNNKQGRLPELDRAMLELFYPERLDTPQDAQGGPQDELCEQA